MSKRPAILYSALLLTGVNLLLRTVGTSFQVYISGRMGASGIGLLQLVLSVGSFAMIAGMGGIRTATMYLCAEELGRNKPGAIPGVLSACFLYSRLCSGITAMFLYTGAPFIARHWIQNPQTTSVLRLYAAFLPIVCLSGVMCGYFTALGKIRTLAFVEVGEQLLSMVVTMFALRYWAGNNTLRACHCVILGSSAGACLTLVSLFSLSSGWLRSEDAPASIFSRLAHSAIPLGAADILKSGITTTENLLVPIRLQMHSGTKIPMAAFGIVTGMVFPVMMFPACILFALAELLIPELARCNAAENNIRIRYLSRRSLKITLLFGLMTGGILWITAEPLCLRLYNNPEAGSWLKLYSILVPILYCDILTDAMTKGLGQQKICVLYNIITSLMDILLLFMLLPRYGMAGYFFSFAITHILNFVLSLRRLMHICRYRFPVYIPLMALSSALLAGCIAKHVPIFSVRIPVYLVCIFCFLYLFGMINKQDIRWAGQLLKIHS